MTGSISESIIIQNSLAGGVKLKGGAGIFSGRNQKCILNMEEAISTPERVSEIFRNELFYSVFSLRFTSLMRWI
ncbi:hypothetical protein CS542_01780 [Pedobacter sp. IW39]|nr:hypothetical protein CS542_01780 [Pedobacter sp. IW39]